MLVLKGRTYTIYDILQGPTNVLSGVTLQVDMCWRQSCPAQVVGQTSLTSWTSARLELKVVHVNTSILITQECAHRDTLYSVRLATSASSGDVVGHPEPSELAVGERGNAQADHLGADAQLHLKVVEADHLPIRRHMDIELDEVHQIGGRLLKGQHCVLPHAPPPDLACPRASVPAEDRCKPQHISAVAAWALARVYPLPFLQRWSPVEAQHGHRDAAPDGSSTDAEESPNVQGAEGGCQRGAPLGALQVPKIVVGVLQGGHHQEAGLEGAHLLPPPKLTPLTCTDEVLVLIATRAHYRAEERPLPALRGASVAISCNGINVERPASACAPFPAGAR